MINIEIQRTTAEKKQIEDDRVLELAKRLATFIGDIDAKREKNIINKS